MKQKIKISKVNTCGGFAYEITDVGEIIEFLTEKSNSIRNNVYKIILEDKNFINLGFTRCYAIDSLGAIPVNGIDRIHCRDFQLCDVKVCSDPRVMYAYHQALLANIEVVTGRQGEDYLHEQTNKMVSREYALEWLNSHGKRCGYAGEFIDGDRIFRWYTKDYTEYLQGKPVPKELY